MTESKKIEKVIIGLKCCMGEGQCCGMYDNCPYNTDKMRCDLATLHQEALAIIEAQMPIEPMFERHFMTNIGIYNCGKCGVSVGVRGLAKYCMNCGQAVKWQ